MPDDMSEAATTPVSATGDPPGGAAGEKPAMGPSETQTAEPTSPAGPAPPVLRGALQVPQVTPAVTDSPDSPTKGPADLAHAGPEREGRRRALPGPPKAQWDTLAAFLQVVYDAQGKKVDLRTVDVDRLAAEAREDADGAALEAARAVIADNAGADTNLLMPVRLLSTMSRAGLGPGRLRRRVHGLVLRAIAACPGLPTPVTGQVLGDDNTAPARVLLDQFDEFFSRSDPKDPKGMELRDNALTCAVLLVAAEERWSDRRAVMELSERVWEPRLRRTGRQPSVGLLAESRSVEQLGFVGSAHRGAVDEARRTARHAADDADAARAALDRQRAVTAEALAGQAQLGEQLAEAGRRLAELRSQLESAREEHRVSVTHAGNDYEVLRTRMVRVLGGQADMLADALHALRNDAAEVTDEFIERVLDAVRKELGTLRRD